ncbi:MAG: transposase [Acidobacteriota bacterium]|nr:transposase [Acidobacteriota bacterium]
MRFTRKNIRLASGSYIGQRHYFVTICCEERRPVFADEQPVLRCLTRLNETSVASRFAVHAFCFMPDHLHLLAEGLGTESSLRSFLSPFKQRTAFEYKRKTGARLWQAKYYDCILRKSAEMEAVAWYIWMNPVRKGLCADPRDFAHSGSMTMPWPLGACARKQWVPPWKPKSLPG